MATAIKKALSLGFLDQAFVSGSNFILGLLLARSLGFGEYGTYVLLWSGVLLLNTAQTSLLISPFQTEYSRLSHAGKRHAERALAGMLGPSLIVATITSISTIILLELFDSAGNFTSPLFLAIGGLAFLVNDFFRRLCLSTGRHLSAFASDFISFGTLLTLTATIPKEHFNIGTFGLCACFSFIGGPLIASLQSKLLHLFKFDTPSRDFVRKFNARDAWLFFATVPQWIASNAPLIMFGIAFGNGFVGALRSAQNLIGITHIAFQALENVAPSIAAQLRASNSKKPHWRKFLFFIGVLLAALTSGIGLSIYANFSEIFLTIYQKSSTIALEAFPYLIATYTLIAISLPTRISLRTLNKSNHIFYGYLISAVLGCIASLTALLLTSTTVAYSTLVFTQAIACLYWLILNRALLRSDD